MLNKNNILIVEDEAIIAMDLEMTLNNMGYNICDIIGSGEDVLPSVQNKKPDLIIMDITLNNKMNGIDVAKILYESNYDTPVVFCSSEINKDRLEKVKLPNTYGFMIKPIKEDSLYTTIELCLDKYKLEKELKEKKEELEQTNEELMQTNEELEQTNEELEQTNEELEETNEELEQTNEELEETNEELKYSEEKLSIIFNNNLDPQILWEVTSKNKLVLVSINQAYIEVIKNYGLNFNKKDFIGKDINEVAKLSGINNDILEYTLKNYDKAITTKEVVKYNIEVLLKGKAYYSEYTLTPILNMKGECNYILFNSHNITDIVNAQKELRENEERFRTVIKNMPILLDAFDENGNITMWNKECEKVTGYSEDEIINSDNPLKLLYPDEDYRKELNDFWNNKKNNVYDKEAVITAKDGTKKTITWYNISKTYPIKGWTEWAIGIDITKRKKLEQALEESEKQYREIFEGSRDGFVIIDTKGHFLKANKAYCDMLGYSIEELKYIDTFYDITPDKWIEWEKKEIVEKRLIEKGYSGIYQKEYIRKDGTVFPVELQSYTVKDENNNIKYLWGVARDITDRVKTEQQIKETKSKLKSLLENTNDIISLRDINNKVIYYNKAFADIIEKAFNVKAFIGMDTMDYLPETNKKHWKHIINNYVLKGEHYSEVFSWDFGNRNIRYFEISFSPILDNDKIIGYSEFNRDITHYRKTHRKLLKYAAELKESNKAFETFAYRVAHDLKNPINNLISGLRLLKTEPDIIIEKKLPLIEEMSNKSHQLIEHINRILKFKQIDINTNFRKIKLKQLLNNITNDFNNLINEKDAIIVTKNIDIEIHADQSLINSLFKNLIFNALKYNENTPKITITVTKRTEDYLFSIIDNGIGIKEEEKNKIFELLYRSNNIKHKYEGTGIGLASCKKIVELHGGTIWVESEFNKGSTFYFTIPIKTM